MTLEATGTRAWLLSPQVTQHEPGSLNAIEELLGRARAVLEELRTVGVSPCCRPSLLEAQRYLLMAGSALSVGLIEMVLETGGPHDEPTLP